MTDILIYGAGAIGSFLGYILSQAREPEATKKIENVALLGRKGHMQKIKMDGLQIDSQSGSEHLHFKYCFTSLDDLLASDFYPEIVIICVKTYSLPEVCNELKESRLLEGRLKNASFLLLMNGMGNQEVFDRLNPSLNRIYEGITSFGVKFSRDGLIELKGMGKTVIEARMSTEKKEFMKNRFEEKGFEIEFAHGFKKHQWNKLFVNCVINPITAITCQQNGIVLSSHLSEAVHAIVKEIVCVARKEGVEADVESVKEVVNSVAEKTSQNTSSMLQDLQKGKMTEIDSINGYIIQLAKKHEIEVPVNEAIYGLVKSVTGLTHWGKCLDGRSQYECMSANVLRGKVCEGFGQGQYYISREGYRGQFLQHLGFIPFPGTLNIKLNEPFIPDASKGIEIEGFQDEGRTFGACKCYKIVILGMNAAIVRPARSNYPLDLVEVIAPVHIKKMFGIANGDEISIMPA